MDADSISAADLPRKRLRTSHAVSLPIARPSLAQLSWLARSQCVVIFFANKRQRFGSVTSAEVER